MGISREGGNISGTSVELVKIKLKKGTRKTRSDSKIDSMISMSMRGEFLKSFF